MSTIAIDFANGTNRRRSALPVAARVLILLVCLTGPRLLQADDGYDLWLKYTRIADRAVAASYRRQLQGWTVLSTGATADAARRELRRALPGLLGETIPEAGAVNRQLVVGTSQLPLLAPLHGKVAGLAPEGFIITHTRIQGKESIAIVSATETGMLYGVFHFLRMMQTGQPLGEVSSSPKTKVRILNHWDNLDRTVERGYAGFSLWDWHQLPGYIDPRYTDYARANASIGINGTVLTNVNANALVLTPMYLEKVKALADVFRPYGIKVYLTARFSAPIELGKLPTADPLDKAVRAWWQDKIREIYTYIPDFGGFTVKANSEGQPGPQNYGRTHADGANMLAEALQPHNGIVMWRAFVYDHQVPEDRTRQAYNEFKPLDGKFLPNVMVQVKNGPLDFQPREPFHPLFGAMPSTALLPEFQLTQEYLGFASHLFYQAPLFKECLDADTYARGKGSPVSNVIDGTLDHHTLTGMAGVANIGNDRNWCGHPLAQANWYAFGRLAWNHQLSPASLADEWIRMTLHQDAAVVQTIRAMLLATRETTVRYMTPLGLHHIMGWNHHYGPAPWIKDKERADWTSVYYHRADEQGIGFDRSARGSNALGQYHPPVQALYNDLQQCPEPYLLWFHHVLWDHTLRSGRTLWDELCYSYQQGVDSVAWMQAQWKTVHRKVDDAVHAHVTSLLAIQYNEAAWWRDACLLYFQQFSKRPLPAGVTKPTRTLEYYQSLEFPFAPGIRPKW
ncbi:alpha-glucuronidase family glycosyl hydrolase [Dawidia soli]|uniref:Xylan alpha-1,2-glucuronidase n=1 Tax=Dawidia soli TaxID=2782352 RepID=A0AAP2DD54_9BACT|nr:alpha-glucuronidase family glycosyl hydrolase [Dawidia soli]MBT1688976.1 alpha-glucuronidase [Dawidia soli]